MQAEQLADGVTLWQGDCLEVLRGMRTGSVDAVVTDPPYGISFQSARRTESERFDEIDNDGQPFIWWLFDAARVLKVGGCVVCFCRWDTADAFKSAMEWAGLKVGAELIWDRVVHGLGDLTGRPAPQHDTILFAVKGRYKLPGKRPTSVYRHQRLSGEQLAHPNEKPLALMRELIRDYVPGGGQILEPFAGSGTTIQAAMMERRPVTGIEINAEYCDLIRDRIRRADCREPGTLFVEAS